MRPMSTSPGCARSKSPLESEVEHAEKDGLLRRLGGSLSHHVNNALAGVIGHLELALRQAEPGTAVHDHLRSSLACACKAADIVKRIVAFACRSPGEVSAGPLALAQVAREAVERLRAQAPSGVNVVLAGEAAGLVWASPGLLRMALEAVLRNAVEALPGGGTLSVRVEVGEGRCLLRVSDSGAGLTPEARARLFEPFWTGKGPGHLGLGLVMARETVQAQGGTLEVESPPGRGVTVTLALPALAARCDSPGHALAPHFGAATACPV